MNRLSRIILGLGCCLITALIILGEYRTERGTILAAELAGTMSKKIREQIESRFRVEDKEDLHWKPLAPDDRVIFDPAVPISQNNRGVEYAEQGRYEQAIVEFTQCIQKRSIYARGYHNRAIIYARQGKLDLAIADLSKAIEMYPDSSNPPYFYSRGVAYTQKGLYDMA